MRTLKHLLIALCLLSLATSGFAAHKNYKKVHILPAFTTQSYLVADSAGTILTEHDIDLVRPIASISKLLLALLVSEQDLDEDLTIPAKRSVQSRIPYKQKIMSRRELLTMALVKSDNFAAQILCENLPNCVESMNNKAAELGMLHTQFHEPTGLSRDNVSTANDLLKLMLVASNNPVITNIASMPSADIQTGKKILTIRNTNPLIDGKLPVILSKTGFTIPAGGCMVMAVNSPFGQRFLVLLGSRNARTRIPEMEKLYGEMQ